MQKKAKTTRSRIVDAALEVFDKSDFDEATIRTIAKKSKISPPIIYKHFGNKEGLANAVANEKARDFLFQMKKELNDIEGVYEKLQKMTWQYLQFYEQNPKVAWVFYVGTSVKRWRESKEAWNTVRDTGQFFTAVVEEGQRRGQIRGDLNIRVARHMYFGCLKEVVQMWLVRGRSYSITAMGDDITEITFNGMRKHRRVNSIERDRRF